MIVKREKYLSLFIITVYIHTIIRKNENAAGKCFIIVEKWFALTGKIFFCITVYIHTVIRKNENIVEKCFIVAEKWSTLTGKMLGEKEK